MRNIAGGRPDMRPDMRAPRGAKNMKQALYTLLRYYKKYIVIITVAILSALISAVLSVLGPNYISKLTETIQNGISFVGIDIDISAVLTLGLTLAGIYAASMILSYIQQFIMSQASCNVGKKMRSDINAKIDKLPLRYFDTHSHGDTLSRVTNDIDAITASVQRSVGSLVTAAVTLILCVILMFITQWIMALTAIVASLIGFVFVALIMSRSQKHFNARQISLAKLSGHIEEYYSGQNIVRAYNAEADGLQKFCAHNEELRTNTFKAEFLSSLMQPLMAFIGNFGYVAVCIVGAALAFNGTIGFPVVVAFMLYVRLFTSPLSQITQGFSGLQTAAAAAERINEFLGEKELDAESDKTAKLSRIDGNVSFEHIHFGYLPDKTVIHDFSLKIKAGQKVAIVGPTGAGKTTIVNLLMRFYELNGGSITVDGVPLSNTTRENVHDIFGMVLQDTWLFEGTVRENLTYGKRQISDAEIMSVLKDCGLSHFVKTLPHGLDTELNDSVTVSAGQKQLLTIARAMVENAPMIILDEATSSVDTRTEKKIQTAMDKLTQGRTSFIIAHRLSTIRDADLIIYMQDGDIKETGTHNELLHQNGFYAELYRSQFATV